MPHSDTEGMSYRQLASDSNRRAGDLANSFDNFTIALIGVRYNGEDKVVDKSGGILGRLEMRVKVLEINGKAMNRALVGMGVLMVLMAGVEKSANIGEFLEKIRMLFH